MIKLRPITTVQTFSIIPVTYNTTVLGTASVVLEENGTSVTDDSVTFSVALSDNENFVEVSLTPSVTFKEGQIYSFELKSETDVFYRDLIYITSQTNKNEVYKMPDTYTEYSHDDEYVILWKNIKTA